MNSTVVMGLDIGSATSKCVLLRDGAVLAFSVVPLGTGTSGPGKAIAETLEKAGLERAEVGLLVATGYGRGSVSEAEETKSELSCHARGAHHLCPEARTVIDIGGQDAKVILLDENGRAAHFVMNDKCAAGTGRFLEVMARVLELGVGDLEAAGEKSRKRLEISSTCTVFAESEVVSHLASNANINDIVAGIHRSVASRVAGLAKRAGMISPLVMTGGVAQNGGVVKALEAELKTDIHVVPNPQIVGALGAALYAQDKAASIDERGRKA